MECMLNQTLPPRNIYLWLSKDQFPTEDTIPESLRRLENSIFQIRMVEGDIRSHKKYYYIVKVHPEDYVFLIDDDNSQPLDSLETINYSDVSCIYCIENGETKNVPADIFFRIYSDYLGSGIRNVNRE